VPAGIAGLLFEQQVQKYFLSPRSAAFFLLLNGLLLFAAERLRRRAGAAAVKDADRRIAEGLTWWRAVKIGLMQILALIPGFSRTGSTIAGGLMAGLSHEDALRYSFLLATPIIAAAALLKLPELALASAPNAVPVALVGALFAAAAAAEVQHRAREHADGEDAEIYQRGRSVDRRLGRRAGDREIEIDVVPVVHADVKHDKENDEQEKGFEDGFEHGGEGCSCR